jgi:hypothetical protein
MIAHRACVLFLVLLACALSACPPARGDMKPGSVGISIAERVPIDPAAPMPRQSSNTVRTDAVDEIVLGVQWYPRDEAPEQAEVTLVTTAGEFVGHGGKPDTATVRLTDGLGTVRLGGLAKLQNGKFLVTAHSPYSGLEIEREWFYLRCPTHITIVFDRDHALADGEDHPEATVIVTDDECRALSEVPMTVIWDVPGGGVDATRGRRYDKLNTNPAGAAILEGLTSKAPGVGWLQVLIPRGDLHATAELPYVTRGEADEGPPAKDAPAQQHEATIRITERKPVSADYPMPPQAPDEIRTDAVDEVTLTVEWLDKTKAPKDGDLITLGSTTGTFIGYGEASNYVTMPAVNGKVSARMAGLAASCYTRDFWVSASHGSSADHGEVFSAARFELRCPEMMVSGADPDVVPADGKSRPRLMVVVVDRNCQPLAQVAVRVRWMGLGPPFADWQTLTTNYAGVATTIGPASREETGAQAQTLCPGGLSTGAEVRYVRPKR